MSAQRVHDALNLYISSDTLTFEPQSVGNQTLVMYRDTGDIKLNGPFTPRHDEIVSVYGIFGVIGLNAGDHVIVITDRERIGNIDSNDVFRMKGYRIIPLARSNRSLPESEKRDDEEYLAMLQSILDLDHFYFSYSFELTHSLQRQANLRSDTRPQWQKADDRFFYNKHLASRLIDASSSQQDLSCFILPVICGFIEIIPGNINGSRFNFVLVARRSRYRNGIRYHSRGIDDDGHVSNFVETEQLAEIESGVSDRTRPTRWSYVQTRGSVPVYWKQVINVKYTPPVVVEENSKLIDSFKKHFAELITTYGDQIAVNLLNKKGSEGRLGTAYSQIVKQIGDPRITYTWFDFHHECKNMKWHNISKLIDSIGPQLAKQGYAAVDRDGRLVSTQTSVVRTNCIDCLDRTNVVQSVLARKALTLQLREAGILREKESVEGVTLFEQRFKATWADHADALSIQYSGTPALKTDFTRTGKRTTQGALADLSHSLTRYFRNNFLDGAKQDAYDLVTGAYEIRPGGPSPLVEGDRGWRYKTVSSARVNLFPSGDFCAHPMQQLPYVLLFSLIMLFGGLLLPSPSFSSQTLYITCFLSLIALCLYDILRHGREFVDLPRLVRPSRAAVAANGFGRVANGLEKKD
ncbi:Phosphoinositide phosphatase sac1 [Gonapodya sp. JEL0774]|nr:Phosphoinositide phosphatase sac1 [Gonapodya sp. JEL0774]